MFKVLKDQNNELQSPQILKRNEQNVFSMLETLLAEEKELLNQKDQLLDLEETLKKRVINEIQAKEIKIKNLQVEIPELKQRLKDLAKTLEIPVVKKIVEIPTDN